MTTCFEEPTLDELLRDPVTRLVMHADGVDTTALRAMFGVLAMEIAARPKPIPSRRNSISGLLRSIVGPRGAMSDASCLCGAR